MLGEIIYYLKRRISITQIFVTVARDISLKLQDIFDAGYYYVLYFYMTFAFTETIKV